MNSTKAVVAILIIVLCAVWLIYRYSPDRNRMETRTQDEKEYQYKCNAVPGHEFKAFGRKSPRPCVVEGCNEEAYIYIVFSCPKLHHVGVLLKTNPDEYRFDGTSSMGWQPFNIDEFFNVPCPQCSMPGLRPAPLTPG